MNLNSIRAMEECERAAWGDFYRAADPDTARNAGIQVHDSDTGLVAIAASANVLGLNRVLGLGIRTPATKDAVLTMTEHFRSAGVPRFFVQLSPAARPEGFGATLEDLGFRHYNNWVRLERSTDDPPAADTPLAIREIDRTHATDFGAIVAECLDWPPEIAPVVAATVGRPGWKHFMAFAGDVPAATGALFAAGGVAWIDFAATREAYRGHGAQKALAVRRIREAASLGCRTVIVETAQPKPERSALSFLNMLKLGFQEAYLRPNYILHL